MSMRASLLALGSLASACGDGDELVVTIAKTYDPNGGGEPEWPVYTSAEPVLVLDTACAFWDARS